MDGSLSIDTTSAPLKTNLACTIPTPGSIDDEGEVTPKTSLFAWLDHEEAPHVPNLLAVALQRRPSREEVMVRGILQPDALDDAPHLPNLLAKKLERRPSLDEVVSSGIVQTGVKVAGKHLARRRLTADLDAALCKRPSVQALRSQGIICDATDEDRQAQLIDPLDAAEKGYSPRGQFDLHCNEGYPMSMPARRSGSFGSRYPYSGDYY